MNERRIVLTVNERLMLSNQYCILEALYPKEAVLFKRMRTIVEEGYELHYNDLNATILESRISVEDCKEVMDILDMYRALLFSYRRIDEKEDIDAKQLEFEGFDGNSSSGRLGYARFLILTQERWQEVLEGRPDFDLNSHRQVIEMYRRMLQVWKEIDDKFNLKKDEIKNIIEAKIHPDYK